MSTFRIVIFTSTSPAKLHHFLRRLWGDLPDVEVAGVLYETGRPALPLKQRLARVKKYLRDPDFIRFSVHKIASQLKRRLQKLLTYLLHLAHGTKGSPNPPPVSLAEVARACEGRSVAFHVTADFHSEASLQFVAGLNSDLGVIYGARILRPRLFSLPRQGSINIHKHKVPEYRGAGAPGLWEMRDGRDEQTVTVHRVLEEVDAGAVLGERSFPIEPLDTLTGVGLKADLASIDCLIDVIRAESLGTSVEHPQPPSATVYKGFQPHQIWAIEEAIRKKRRPFRPRNGRPLIKLVLRMLAYPVLYFRNRRRAEEKNFPIVILYHHLITDREKYMGLPTHYFLRHVEFLQEHYRLASLPEALEMLKKGEVDAPTVVLSFDDGYACNFLGLRAVAEAENIPVTLFVSTRHVAECSEFQHDIDRREHGFPAMSWDEVRHMERHGVCVGSHTRTHFDCGDADEDRLHQEIVGSLEDMRRELGHDVPYFSFPKGHPENMSEPARRIALHTYPYVFSAYGGVNHATSPGSILKRSGHPESLLELELTLQSMLNREPADH